MCVINAVGRTLLNVMLADFIVTMTVSSVAHSSLVSRVPAGRPRWTTSPAQASGRSLSLQHGSIRHMGALGDQNIGCARGLGNRYRLNCRTGADLMSPRFREKKPIRQTRI